MASDAAKSSAGDSGGGTSGAPPRARSEHHNQIAPSVAEADEQKLSRVEVLEKLLIRDTIEEFALKSEALILKELLKDIRPESLRYREVSLREKEVARMREHREKETKMVEILEEEYHKLVADQIAPSVAEADEQKLSPVE